MMQTRRILLASVLALGVARAAGAAPTPELLIKMQGSPVASHVMSGVAPVLRESGITIKVTAEGSSSEALAALGSGRTDIALMTRQPTGEERAEFPEKAFEIHQIGTQAIALIVSRPVWESGVRALSRQQVADIYEGRITNWKQVGGAAREIKFFNSERGRGIWELFATWCYGEIRKAPLPEYEIVVNGEDARNSVYFNAGAISMAGLHWVDRDQIFPLAIKDEKGVAIEPTLENIATEKYPLARPVIVVFGGKPLGEKKKLLEFLLSPIGQDLVRKSDLVPLSDLQRK